MHRFSVLDRWAANASVVGCKLHTTYVKCLEQASWSWASLDGRYRPASFADDETTDRLIRIIEYRVETATNDPFGVVNAGTLTLCGWLATRTLTSRQDSAHEWSVFFNGSWLDDRMMYIALGRVLPHLRLRCFPVVLDRHQSPECNLLSILLIATGVQRGQFQRAGALHVLSGGKAMGDWAAFQILKMKTGWRTRL